MKNLRKALHRHPSTGNYFGYYYGHYISVHRRPHGGYTCMIGKRGQWLTMNGFFTKALPTMADVYRWIRISMPDGVVVNPWLQQKQRF